MQGLIGLVFGLPALVGMFFTWRSISRWLTKRNPDNKKAGLYALYVVAALAVLGAAPVLFPGNLRYLAGAAWLGFVLVGLKHGWGWYHALKRHETGNLLFAEASMAVCARVANADGTIQEEEKATVAELIRELPELKEFKFEELYRLFEKHCEALAKGATGMVITERAIGAIKDDSGAAAAAMQVGVAIAKADGKFEESEKQALRECAQVLGLDPTVYTSAS